MSPGIRFASGASAVNKGEILIFGGSYDGKYLNDTWIFNGATNSWRLAGLSSSITMPGLKYSAVARLNDHGGNKNLIMFGGCFVHNGKKEYLSRTLKFLADKDSWVAVDVTISPPPREYHRMVRTNAGPLVFGGRNHDSLYDDLWLFSGNTWVQIKQQNSDADWPLPANVCQWHQILMVVLSSFGGNGDKTESLGDTWLFLLSNKTWVQISVPPKILLQRHKC